MSGFVLDCSVTGAWCFEDEKNPVAEKALDSLATGIALVPAMWPLEMANVLLMAERRRRITRAHAIRSMELLRSLPIEVDESTPSRAMGEILALAREQDLSVYDAAYLKLAVREGIPLATLDRALATAAKRCGVPLK